MFSSLPTSIAAKRFGTYRIQGWHLTNAQIAIGLTVLCAATRFLALPASLWEWDDILFARALHRFDLHRHSPHPPGFPVFVLLTRAFNFLLQKDQLALALVSLLFASALGAGLYYFYLALFQERRLALGGSLLGMFAPNVWIYSGAGRSDEVGFSLGIIGLTLMLRGLRSTRAFLSGCALLGLGMGVRVTLLPVMGLLIIVVSLFRLYHKQWRIVLGGACLSFAGFLSWYIPVIVHTTLPVYREVTALHTKFWLSNDTIVASTDNGILSYRFSRFFLDIWGDWKIAIAVYALATLGLLCLLLLRKWQVLGWLVVCFLPFMTFTLMLNTPLSAPFYSLPYIPLFTGLVACGLMIPCQVLGRKWGVLSNLEMVVVVGCGLGLANWSYPVVKLLRKEASPPIQAALALQKRMNPEKDKLYFDGLFTPHIYYFFESYQTATWMRDESLALNLIDPTSGDFQHFYLLSTEPVTGVPSEHFQWTPGRGLRRLRPVSMGRYFDVYVSELSSIRPVSFTSGWYDTESLGAQSWRWMGKRGTITLFNEAAEMTLHLRGKGITPDGPTPPPTTIIVKLDGREIERIAGTEVNLTRTIKTNPAKYWSVLTIETEHSFVPKQRGGGTDERELGFQCFEATWDRGEQAAARKFTDDQFVGEGWYSLDKMKPRSWRWANHEAILHLPAIEGEAQLSLIMQVPEQANGTRAKVTVEISGQVLETFQPSADVFTKTFRVPATIHNNTRCDLKLSADGNVSTATDPRKRAFGVTSITWIPAGDKRRESQ